MGLENNVYLSFLLTSLFLSQAAYSTQLGYSRLGFDAILVDWPEYSIQVAKLGTQARVLEVE